MFDVIVGTIYFIIVDGYDGWSSGPYTLSVGDCVFECDGKFCGSDGCGGSCGECTGGNVCDW